LFVLSLAIWKMLICIRSGSPPGVPRGNLEPNVQQIGPLGLFQSAKAPVRRRSLTAEKVVPITQQRCQSLICGVSSALETRSIRTVPIQRKHRVAFVGNVELVLVAGGGLRIDEQTVVHVEILG
jgi:hypothetical protein